MKNFLSSLVVLITAISSLSAQTTGTPDNPPILTPPNTDNPPAPVITYPIGTISQPVVAGEYCTFLTDTLAPQNELSQDSLKEKFGITADGPLACDGLANNYAFYWDLNRSSEIITTVPSLEVQQLFNNWRNNPYSQELLDYMLDVYHTDPKSIGSKIGRNHTTYAPSNILQLYPSSTTLPKAKNLALYPAGANYLLYNERGVPVSIDVHTPINPKNFISTDRYKLQSYDYHRPVAIGPAL